MRPLTILRTGAGSLPSPPVIEGLRSLGCRVIAADVDPFSVGFTCADSWRPIPRANAPAFGASILSLCREERVDAILPAVNEEIPRLADIREELEGRGTALIAPTAAAIEVCLDKALTTQALRGLDVPTPEIWDPAQGTAALEGVRFPALIKPRSGRGSRGIRRLRDREELSFHLARAGEPVVVQRWVEGEELTFDLLADPQGELRMACARRRLRVSAGISVAGEIVSSAPFLGLLERIVRGIPLPGPSCLQCIVGRDGEAMFTDLNPRLGGGVALALAGGTPILGGILAGLRGEPIRRSFDAGVGLRFLRKYDEVYLEPGASL